METKRKNVNLDIKDRLMEGNIQLQNMFGVIRDYATRPGVVEYVPMNGPEFVLTNKLKVLSGRILARSAFVFRLAYIKAIKNKYNIILPIIIDSPRAAELSPKSTSGMYEILHSDFPEHQIILASIYKTDISGFHIIDLNNGFFGLLE